MRRVSVTVRNGSTLISRVTNSFDNAGRLDTVGNGTVSATYSYRLLGLCHGRLPT